MKLRTIIITISLFGGFISMAQETLSLKDAVALALQQNYSISMAENNSRISGINNSAGNAGMLPKLDLTGTRSISVNNSHAEYFDGRVRDVADAKTNN
ncbi:MAG: hypothetical protein WAO52_13915, partial [Prolixibacteraceae bacterium]